MSASTGGFDLVNNSALNKDSAFSSVERHVYGLQGIIAPRFMDMNLQAKLAMINIRDKSNDLEKYIYLMELHSRNVRLFFYTVMHNVYELLPYIYTPTVGTACIQLGKIYTRPKGLFITIDDINQIESILNKWPERNIKAICVTDGERILGLGDLGANGMGIPIGKLVLYTTLGGVDPSFCLPITLDVGTNNKEFLEDEFYLGLKRKRGEYKAYEAFVDEFMQACAKLYGPDVLIQFEDFGNHNAFYFLHKYRTSYCMFNDDIQGTAAVVVAGIINASKILDRKVSENVFLFYGAGEATLGIASLLVMLMEEDGIAEDHGRRKIFMIDSKGLIVENRPKGGITPLKGIFAQKMDPIDSLLDVIKKICPTILIGASAQKDSFDAEVLKTMAKLNGQPVVIALSNPTSKSECTAEAAYKNTNGSVIFASGSPFKPYVFGNKTIVTGQANNSYIFPGLAFAILHARIHPIHDKLFLEAAKALARKVTAEELKSRSIYPSLSKISKVSLAISIAVCEYSYRSNTAHFWPEPPDKKIFLEEKLYKPIYESLIPLNLVEN